MEPPLPQADNLSDDPLRAEVDQALIALSG